MLNRKFQRRYLFIGTLTLKTGLHIGSGWTVGGVSDKPVIRTIDGRPFIPGSSFKGAFRSTVEKLASSIGLNPCLLEHEDSNSACLTPQKSKKGQDFRQIRESVNQVITQSENHKKLLEALTRLGCSKNVGDVITQDDLAYLLKEHLCSTCQLFGSPYVTSGIIFSDLMPPINDTLADKMIQVRDGVAIDRDSEKAVDQLKFDYEVVAPAQTFELKIWLDDPSDLDLGLTCIGLSEFVSGFGFIGGNRSRGLGNCQLEGLTIYELDLNVAVDERSKRLKKYLLGRNEKDKMTVISNTNQFLDQKITKLLSGGSHA